MLERRINKNNDAKIVRVKDIEVNSLVSDVPPFDNDNILKDQFDLKDPKFTQTFHIDTNPVDSEAGHLNGKNFNSSGKEA